jgi:hypothetical protein
MKYKRGDRVKIKSLDWYNQNKDQHGRVACGYHVFTEDMSKFCGCTMIVCNRTNLGVMTMGGSASYWTDEMIEGIAVDLQEDKMVSLNKVEKYLRENIILYVWATNVDQQEEWFNNFRKAMEE